jgi:hypothetical protein
MNRTNLPRLTVVLIYEVAAGFWIGFVRHGVVTEHVWPRKREVSAEDFPCAKNHVDQLRIDRRGFLVHHRFAESVVHERFDEFIDPGTFVRRIADVSSAS